MHRKLWSGHCMQGLCIEFSKERRAVRPVNCILHRLPSPLSFEISIYRPYKQCRAKSNLLPHSVSRCPAVTGNSVTLPMHWKWWPVHCMQGLCIEFSRERGLWGLCFVFCTGRTAPLSFENSIHRPYVQCTGHHFLCIGRVSWLPVAAGQLETL